MAHDAIHQPSLHSQRMLAVEARKRARSHTRYVLAVISVVVLLAAMIFCSGCATYASVHGGAAALATDLELYVDNTAPAPVLTPAEQTLPPEKQNEILTNRHNLIRLLGEELKKTSKKLEEALR